MSEDNALTNTPDNLDDFIINVLPEIDQLLAKRGESLSQRPHRAACFIVEHYIERIDSKTKAPFIVEAWFGVLLSHVIDWYEHVYGDAMWENAKKKHTAVLLIRNTPTALEVPLTFFSPLGEDGTRWLTFASDILPDEDPMNWLLRPPNLSLLDKGEFREISTEAISTSVNIRRASNGILTIHKDYPQSRQHASLVLQYLEQVAQNILSNEGPALSTAVWDANFAAEQAIKCYLNQSLKTKVPTLHDVQRLAALASVAAIPQEVEEALKAMPSGKDAVRYRYNEFPAPSLSLMMDFYRAALVICRFFLNAHPRDIRFDNARFQLRFPPMPGTSGGSRRERQSDATNAQ